MNFWLLSIIQEKYKMQKTLSIYDPKQGNSGSLREPTFADT